MGFFRRMARLFSVGFLFILARFPILGFFVPMARLTVLGFLSFVAHLGFDSSFSFHRFLIFEWLACGESPVSSPCPKVGDVLAHCLADRHD